RVRRLRAAQRRQPRADGRDARRHGAGVDRIAAGPRRKVLPAAPAGAAPTAAPAPAPAGLAERLLGGLAARVRTARRAVHAGARLAPARAGAPGPLRGGTGRKRPAARAPARAPRAGRALALRPRRREPGPGRGRADPGALADPAAHGPRPRG